jgi:hypothetical protein
MRFHWRELFTSKLNKTGPWDRWDFVALALAVFITVWLFTLKLKTFYDLGYSCDLFVDVQLARTWLGDEACFRTTVLETTLLFTATFCLCSLDL